MGPSASDITINYIEQYYFPGIITIIFIILISMVLLRLKTIQGLQKQHNSLLQEQIDWQEKTFYLLGGKRRKSMSNSEIARKADLYDQHYSEDHA